ncbi:hypothetical protein DID88_009925 [Monilinia fructigena]|uniref:RNase H type-1 domain-containing protein n=1 Tax=Monilinia fructigena TaxID=38457 RepID=A0A395ICI6_9HELO|nr:hypothetical protein DID88_009925 [Monilinia fructigena]
MVPPGHMGIEGNEAADELANTGANEGRTDDDRSAEPTISGIGTTRRPSRTLQRLIGGVNATQAFRPRTADGSSDTP